MFLQKQNKNKFLKRHFVKIADEWIDWTTSSIQATDGLVADYILQIWSKLRAGMLFYLSGSSNVLEREKAQKDLIEGAKMAEEVGGLNFHFEQI